MGSLAPEPKVERNRLLLRSLSFEELAEVIGRFDQKPFRARQVFKWIHQKRADSFQQMTDLSLEMRNNLSAFDLGTLKLSDKITSCDGSIKLLWETRDNYCIESVIIPETSRTTLCISTQIGCNLGCKFCCTGQWGLKRDLQAAEILSQVYQAQNLLTPLMKVTNLVFMGMGEPLINFDNTLTAIKLLSSQDGQNFSHRKITISTAGIVPRIREMSKTIPFNLAISLNAPNDKIRSEIMPINRAYPLKMLLSALKDYPLPKRKRFTFEYVLLKDFNDSISQAQEVIKLLKGLPYKINLLTFNPFAGAPFQTPSPERVAQFQQVFLTHKKSAFIRQSRGKDIGAACGQLGTGIET